MANHSRAIVLSDADRVSLERLQRSSSGPAGLSRRARVVLLLADAVTGAEARAAQAWVSILKRKSVRRGSFDTVQALVRHIEQYIAHWNANPTSFVWTREPADMIKKAIRRPR